MSRPFAIVDVFTREPLGGNPLAVVGDAEGLPDGDLARLAREFNQSETTFLLPATRTGAHWRLRSFTGAGIEVFGAGHNALGAWWWLAASGRLALPEAQNAFRQEIGEHVLPLEVQAEAGRPLAITMEQMLPDFGAIPGDRHRLAAALGLDPADLEAEAGLPPQVVSTGAAHLLVPARDRAAVERAFPDRARLLAQLRSVAAEGCYLFSLETVDPSATAHARFFNPTVGIVEDPATGTAAGPLACYLMARSRVARGATVVVEQGHAMGRPSRIELLVSETAVRIVGSAVVLAEGALLAP